MKKSFLTILVSSLLVLTFSLLPSFYTLAASSVDINSKINQPVASKGSRYFGIYDPVTKTSRLYEFYLPPGYDVNEIDFDVQWTVNSQGNWEFMCTTSIDSGVYPLYVYMIRYNLENGTFYQAVTRDTNTVYSLSLSASTYSRYVNYGCIVNFPNNSNTNGLPALGSVAWAETIDYSTQFAAVQSLLSTANYELSDINDNLSLIYLADQTFFRFMMNDYYSTITGKWNLTNSKLDRIIELLGGNESTTLNQEYNTELDNQVNENISQEDQFLDDFDNNVRVIDDSFDELDNILSDTDTLNGFAFIKNIFNTFVVSGSLNYIVIITCLIIGLLLTIIGKRIKG